MASYSKEEIKSFKEKDLRITKLAIQKELIKKLDIKEINDPESNLFKLCDKYVNYTYKPLIKSNLEDKKEVAISWVTIAEGLNLALPDTTNIKMLDILVTEYNKVNEASANPSEILTFIMNKYGRYPTKQQNVEKVLEMFCKM